MVAMIFQTSLEAKSPSPALRCALGACALLARRAASDLGQPRAGDAAFAGSFITRPYVPTMSSGVMFVNTAAMCARARGEASNPAPGGEVKPWRWDQCRSAGQRIAFPW